MSGLIDSVFNIEEVTDVIIDAIGMMANGIIMTGEVVVSGLAFSARKSYEMCNKAVTAIQKDINQLNKESQKRNYEYRILEQKHKEMALTFFQKQVEKSEALMKDYISTMIKQYNFSTLNLNETQVQEIVNSFPLDQRRIVMDSMIFMLLHVEKIEKIIEKINEIDLDIEQKDKMIKKLRMSVDEYIENHNYYIYDHYDQTSNKIEDLYKQTNAEFLDIFENQKSNNKFDEFKLVLEEKISIPYIYIFNGHLFDLLHDKSIIDSATFNAQQTLEKRILINQYLETIEDFETIDNVDELINLIHSIERYIENDEILNKTKLQEIEKRQINIESRFEDIKLKNDSLIRKREIYNKLLKENHFYRANLNLKLRNDSNLFERIDLYIEQLEEENTLLSQKLQSMLKIEKIQEKIKSELSIKGYKHLKTLTSTRRSVISQDSYYLNKNGHVLRVTANDKERVIYKMTGVIIDGVEENKDSLVNSMHDFCADHKVIEKNLKDQNIDSINNALYEPSLDIADFYDYSMILSPQQLEEIKEILNQETKNKQALLEREIS